MKESAASIPNKSKASNWAEKALSDSAARRNATLIFARRPGRSRINKSSLFDALMGAH